MAELTPDQVFAAYKAEDWWKNRTKQVFEISGRAGSGKTYCIRYILQQLGIPLKKVLFAAFTGKAATVLARNGLPAMTTCAAFYEFVPEICRDEDNHMIILPNGKPKTKLVKRKLSHLKKNYLAIVIDESTMINEPERADIESFGLPIFALGDLNQLPPVFGKPAFMNNPDVTLRQIMRQAEDDPIVWIANRIIEGESLVCGVYGNSCIKKRSDLTEMDFKQADMVITGTNKLRHGINQMFREQFKHIVRLEYPHVGEKVLCVHNNWGRSIGDTIYLTNGLTGFVDYVDRESFNGKRIKIDFQPDFTNKVFRNVVVDYNRLMRTDQFLQTENSSFFGPTDMDQFDFGYAVTCHKAQGSGWEKVLGLAEMFSTDLDYVRKYLYTMVTRASFGLTLAIEKDKIYLS